MIFYNIQTLVKNIATLNHLLLKSLENNLSGKRKFLNKTWLSSNRSEIMGLGILLVVLFHAFCTFGKLFILFSYGFIGVDFFMLVSGFGLCRSYQTNCISEFYKHRFIRVLPLFMVFALAKSLLYEWFGTPLLPTDYLLNLTSLSYYGLGGQFIDWYLCSILLLYLLYPVLYAIVEKNKLRACVGAVILCLIVYTLFPNLHWSYICLISRVPIFLLGIYIYLIISSLPPRYMGSKSRNTDNQKTSPKQQSVLLDVYLSDDYFYHFSFHIE